MELTDGTITLKPFTLADAEAHLAGDDVEQEKWLSGGKSTLQSVRKWITTSQESWENDGPVFNFAIWLGENLIGMVEANTDYEKITGLQKGDANISYSIYPDYRGNKYAQRAVSLMAIFLKDKKLNRAVIRVLPENEKSVKVPINCGFKESGTVLADEGELVVYIKELN